MKKFIGLIVFSAMITTSSYAEVKDIVVEESKLPPEGCKTTITISLDIIECAPEKLKEYGLKYPPSLTDIQSGKIRPDKEIRDKLSRLKKDKDIKILYSTKLTTYPDNRVIVDNRQPLEYLVPKEKGEAGALKKEIMLVGNFFEVKPTITKDGEVVLDYHFWVSERVHRVSTDKRIPEELGHPAQDGYGSTSSMQLKDGETVVLGGVTSDSRTKSLRSVGFVTEQKRKSVIICFGVDINRTPSAP